jgi:hypothetical protein
MPGPAPARTPAKQSPAAPAAIHAGRRTNTARKEWPLMPEMQNGQEEHGSNSPGIIEGPRIISYNLNEDERPDGLKVRYKVRIETGKKAATLDAAQAQALKELLQWARNYRAQHQQ